MKKTIRIILKWIFRIFLVFASLIIIVFVGFYTFKGKIMDKALEIANEKQPGDVRIGNLHLRPFMNFPNVSLQLKELEYLQGDSLRIMNDTIPVLDMEDVYVSLNVVQLVKGNYKVSKIRFADGEINYLVGNDSISNLEKALGIRFGASTEKDTVKNDSSNLSLDLKSLEIENLRLKYSDLPGKMLVSMKINDLESAFSYLTNIVRADLNLELDLNEAGFGDIVLDKPRTLAFSSSLDYDLEKNIVNLGKSSLNMRDVMIELGGKLDLSENSNVDVDFKASNKGIELLNFLMSGVLDMDAIEQIGEGQIDLNGTVRGSFANQLPVLNLNFSASDIGFDVNAIGQSVQDINFSGNLTNGSLKDFSEMVFNLDHFHASFPDGEINAGIKFSNLLVPNIELDIKGEADLSLINEILNTETLTEMKGNLYLDGLIFGRIDKSSGEFFNNGGALVAEMKDVSMKAAGYNIKRMNGEFFVSEKDAGFRNFNIDVDSNLVALDLELKGILSYLAGFENGVSTTARIRSKEIFLDKLLKDTSMQMDPFRNVDLTVKASLAKKEMDKVIEHGEIPNAKVGLQNLAIEVSGYNRVSIASVDINILDDVVSISKFNGRVGDSDLSLQAAIRNYDAFIEKDSIKEIELNFRLKSRSMKAEDLLTFNGQFMVLPEVYSKEEMLDFEFVGKLETTLGELLSDKALPDVRFICNTLQWDFRYYPLSFNDFLIDVQTEDSVILVNNFEGRVGESNIRMNAALENLFDSTKVLAGNLNIESSLLDINQLLNYELLEEGEEEDTGEVTEQDTVKNPPADLSKIDFPDFRLNLNIGELRYGGNTLFGLKGNLRSNPYKILFLDRFMVQSKSGGKVLLDGMFNVSDPEEYTLSANFDINKLDLSDFDLKVVISDTVYTLEDNFNGIFSGQGIAELFLNPDFSIDMETSTAMFNVLLENGRVRNFTPLQAAAKFTGNKDLNDVKFGRLTNPLGFVLANGMVQIPLMEINSSLGLILIEGEQSLGADFMYLVRVPTKLVSKTAWNVLSNQQRKEIEEESEVQEFRAQKFYKITAASVDGETYIKAGDKREKIREEARK